SGRIMPPFRVSSASCRLAKTRSPIGVSLVAVLVCPISRRPPLVVEIPSLAKEEKIRQQEISSYLIRLLILLLAGQIGLLPGEREQEFAYRPLLAREDQSGLH